MHAGVRASGFSWILWQGAAACIVLAALLPCVQYFVSRVAPLFFVLHDLANVRHTYQFGLTWFMGEGGRGRERAGTAEEHSPVSGKLVTLHCMEGHAAALGS